MQLDQACSTAGSGIDLLASVIKAFEQSGLAGGGLAGRGRVWWAQISQVSAGSTRYSTGSTVK
jgi:hypothetical protein